MSHEIRQLLPQWVSSTSADCALTLKLSNSVWWYSHCPLSHPEESDTAQKALPSPRERNYFSFSVWITDYLSLNSSTYLTFPVLIRGVILLGTICRQLRETGTSAGWFLPPHTLLRIWERLERLLQWQSMTTALLRQASQTNAWNYLERALWHPVRTTPTVYVCGPSYVSMIYWSLLEGEGISWQG